MCYQDFKDTFVCNTQLETSAPNITEGCVIRISKILLYAIHNLLCRDLYLVVVVLSGFQRYFCMQYTTSSAELEKHCQLCYQDFKDTFVCNTQLRGLLSLVIQRCVIRISKILLYAIHNYKQSVLLRTKVVLSGFQRYFCMQYTTDNNATPAKVMLCYQDFKEQFEGYASLTIIQNTYPNLN